MATDLQPAKVYTPPSNTELYGSGWATSLQSSLILKRLAIKVLSRAVEDAMGKNIPKVSREMAMILAREWLVSETCELYCHIAGCDFEKMQKWVNAGCPEPDNSLQDDRAEKAGTTGDDLIISKGKD